MLRLPICLLLPGGPALQTREQEGRRRLEALVK